MQTLRTARTLWSDDTAANRATFTPSHIQEENMLLRAQLGEEAAHDDRAIVVRTIPPRG